MLESFIELSGLVPKEIAKRGIENVIADIEEADLSDNYWRVGLVQDLRKATISNPFVKLFFAAQVYFQDKALFSESVTVQKLIEIKGDVHHIFPKDYLQKAGLRRSDYNQIANLVYLQQEVNVKIGAKAPKEYFGAVLEGAQKQKLSFGLITDKEALIENLRQNAIPENIFEMDLDDYEHFLEERRRLMAQKIEKFYKSL